MEKFVRNFFIILAVAAFSVADFEPSPAVNVWPELTSPPNNTITLLYPDREVKTGEEVWESEIITIPRVSLAKVTCDDREFYGLLMTDMDTARPFHIRWLVLNLKCSNFSSMNEWTGNTVSLYAAGVGAAAPKEVKPQLHRYSVLLVKQNAKTEETELINIGNKYSRRSGFQPEQLMLDENWDLVAATFFFVEQDSQTLSDLNINPNNNFRVSYVNHTVSNGMRLNQSEILKAPVVTFDSPGCDSSASYALMLYDHDSHNPNASVHYVRWLRVNLMCPELLQAGDELLSYDGRIDERKEPVQTDNAAHHFILILLKQKTRGVLDKSVISNYSAMKIDIKKFLVDANLAAVAGVYYNIYPDGPKTSGVAPVKTTAFHCLMAAFVVALSYLMF